jgi:CubicO group peptidase (beta-lactamase class C family)
MRDIWAAASRWPQTCVWRYRRVTPVDGRSGHLKLVGAVAGVLAAVAILAPAGAARVVARASAQTAASQTGYGRVKATLSGYIRQLMAENRTAGLAIALVDGRRVVWTQGFGYADVAARRRVTADTVFHIGSVTKTFTAAAVMQLVARGLVDLDAPLSRYVPGFSLRKRFPGRNAITVRTVLDHHSGIPGTLPKGFITTGKPDPGYTGYMLRTLRSLRPTSRVNVVAGYDNSGYVLLGKLVKHVSGLNLEDYAQRYLFGPMGMRSTHYDDRLAAATRLTRNYQASSSDGKPMRLVAKPREYVNGWGAGSITSTARDMAGYLKMLVQHGQGSTRRVLEPAGLRTMWTRQTDLPLDRWNCCSGLGWTRTLPQLNWAGPVVYKGGDTQWAHAIVMVLPGSNLAVAVLTNTSSREVRAPVAVKALELAYTAKTGRRAPAIPALPGSPPASVTQRALCADSGLYATSAGLDRVSVAPSEAGLVWTRNAGTPLATSARFTASRDGWFRSGTDKTQIAFRTVAGRRLMLARRLEAFVPPSLVPYTEIASERVPDGQISASWAARLGRYRAEGVARRDTIVARSARLVDSDGVLVLDLDTGEHQVLQPASGSRAFTFGLGGPLPALGKGDSVTGFRTTGGRTGFTYLGVRYLRVATRSKRTRNCSPACERHATNRSFHQRRPFGLAVPPETTSALRVEVSGTPQRVHGSDGREHIEYDLIVTNAFTAEATLRSLVVGADGQRLLTLSGDRLWAATVRLGTSAPTGGRVGPASTVVTQVGVVLPRSAGRTVPRLLTNQIRYAIPATAPSRPVIRTTTVDLSAVRVDRRAPVVIASPLRGTGWLNANGCCDDPTARHRNVVLATSSGRYITPEMFAIDWIREINGRAFTGDGSKNSDWPTFGAPVYAVADGIVTSVVDDKPDIPPSSVNPLLRTPRDFGGNSVFLRIRPGLYACYAHLKRGSVRVRPGQRVRVGQRIGLAGNSGNTSAPHLHFGIQRRPNCLSPSVPFEIDRYVVEGTVASDTAPPRIRVIGRPHREQRSHPLITSVTTLLAPGRSRR